MPPSSPETEHPCLTASHKSSIINSRVLPRPTPINRPHVPSTKTVPRRTTLVETKPCPTAPARPFVIAAKAAIQDPAPCHHPLRGSRFHTHPTATRYPFQLPPQRDATVWHSWPATTPCHTCLTLVAPAIFQIRNPCHTVTLSGQLAQMSQMSHFPATKNAFLATKPVTL